MTLEVSKDNCPVQLLLTLKVVMSQKWCKTGLL